jgi:hypothetical protein
MPKKGGPSAQTRYEPADDLSMVDYFNRLRISHDPVKQHEISPTFRIHHRGNSPRGSLSLFLGSNARRRMVEEGDCYLARRILKSCQTAGKDVPAGTMAMVSSSERPTAIATLNRQRHLTPSCGGLTPTAEKTVDRARMIVGELDHPDPELPLGHADRLRYVHSLGVDRK